MAKTPEEQAAYQKAYYEANKAKRKAYHREYYLKHRPEQADKERIGADEKRERRNAHLRAETLRKKDLMRSNGLI